MPRTITIELPEIDECDFTIEVEFDDTPVRGNAMASGDDDHDREIEDAIIERCNSGDVWAWACVRVVCSWGEFEGDDYLGGCSYADEDEFKQTGGYYDDMRQQAYDNLIERIESMSNYR